VVSCRTHLEALPNAEEEIEVPRMSDMRRVIVKVQEHRIYGRIQVIAEIDTDRTHRRFVTSADTNRMREIIEVALSNRSRNNRAGLVVRLMETQKAGKHIARVLKDVPHIVKQHKADTVADIGQSGRRQTQLQRIHQDSLAAHRESRL